MFLCSYIKQTIPLTEASIDNIKVKPAKKLRMIVIPEICLYIHMHAYSRCIDMIMYVFLIFSILFLTPSNPDQMGLLCQFASIDIGKIKSGL